MGDALGFEDAEEVTGTFFIANGFFPRIFVRDNLSAGGFLPRMQTWRHEGRRLR